MYFFRVLTLICAPFTAYVLQIELLSPVNGDVRASISIDNQNHTGSEDNSVVGLHLFRRERLGSSSRYYLCLL